MIRNKRRYKAGTKGRLLVFEKLYRSDDSDKFGGRDLEFCKTAIFRGKVVVNSKIYNKDIEDEN